MNKKILMIAVGVLVIAGAAGFGAYKAMSKPAPAVEEPIVQEVEPAGLLEMETFLANINHGVEERYAKLQLKLAITPKSKAEKVKQDELLMAQMRDRVLTLLTSKTYEELSDPMGKEGFRSEIRMRLEPLVEDGVIREVLFAEFVVQ